MKRKINRHSNKGRALHRKMVLVLTRMLAEEGCTRSAAYAYATRLHLPADIVGRLMGVGFEKSGKPRTYVEADEAFTELERSVFAPVEVSA